jgi:hypothetical protein
LNIVGVIHMAPKTSCKQNDQEKGFITFETFPQRIPFDWPQWDDILDIL